MDIAALVQSMVEEGQFAALINNPIAQFGARSDPFFGATLLPEVARPENYYREESIQYRSIIANHGTRYSSVQLKKSVLTGYMEVSLAESDIGSQFTGQDYDTLLRILNGGPGVGNAPPMPAVTQLLNWAEAALLRPLNIANEKMRWDAIVDALVVRTGDDNYYDEVAYPNPAGHRFNAGGAWTNDAYDPYDDILAAALVLTNKGYSVGRIIMGTPVLNMLLSNDKMKQKVGKITVAGGTVIGLPGRLTKAQLNEVLSDDGLPPIEVYNAQYRLPSSTAFYLKRDVAVVVANTGRDQNIETGDVNPLTLNNTLGYVGIGRPVGQTGSTKVVKVRAEMDSKPPHIAGEAWQTSLPVLQDPEALAVIKTIA